MFSQKLNHHFLGSHERANALVFAPHVNRRSHVAVKSHFVGVFRREIAAVHFYPNIFSVIAHRIIHARNV